nr:hypothetical protein [Tanacetum cinerariifolium]
MEVAAAVGMLAWCGDWVVTRVAVVAWLGWWCVVLEAVAAAVEWGWRSLVDKIICDLNKAPDSPHLHTFLSNQRHCFHCKDVLGDGEFCQRCTCMRCESGISKGLCLICKNNQNSLNDSPSISENSSQSPPNINHHCCYECGDPLDGIFCKRCTYKSCGKGAHIGYNCPPKVLWGCWRGVVVWPAVDGDEGGVVLAARWGAGCGVESGGDVVVVLEAVAAAARVGTEVQVAMYEALVPHAQRLRIGRSNFRLLSDIKSKESTLDMLHIYMRVHGQSFDEPPFKKEILAFIRFLGHSAPIRTLTDVNINKLYQAWRSFAAIINKCLTGKSSGYDSLRLYQAQILWGLYHKRNVDYAYLMWEDFLYQVEHKNSKKSNEMYYPRFTKVIIHHFMSKDPSILRRNKVNWHYVRDDHMNSNAYKEYYAIATGAAPPKPKASVQKTRSSFDTSITPPNVVVGPRLTASAKGKQTAKASTAKSLSALSEVAMTEAQQLKLVTKRSMQQTHISQASGSGADEGTGSIPGVLDVPTGELEEELSLNSTDDKGAEDEGRDGDGDEEDEGDDGEEGDDEGNDDEDLGLNVGKEEGHVEEEEEEEDELYRDTPTSVAPLHMSAPTMTPSTIATITTTSQSDHLRDEAQRENDEFLKTVDENMKKIIKEQVKEQVKTSYAVVADLSKMELKKILIDKMEGNKSIQRSDEQRNLYKALVEAYESDKIILDTYRETVTLKRRRNDDADKDEEPSAGPDRGSKKRKEGKEPESASAPTETATRSAGRWKSPHIQSLIQKPPTPDRDWNKTLPAVHESIQPWIRELAKQAESRSSFSKLMDTPLDFSNFLINRLKVDTLTPKLLAGPTYELMKGSCKSLVELEYHLEEVFKATTNQMDWVNPEGQQYPHNLLKPIPLIPNNRGRRVIPFEHFINNDIEYLHGGALSRKYTTSIMKTKAADYGHIKWIEDLVPRTMWIEEPIGYNKHAL